MTEWPIPPRAQALLRERLAVRQQAENDLAQAVSLVLASIGAPEDAQVVVNTDGSMLATLPNVGKQIEGNVESPTDSP